MKKLVLFLLFSSVSALSASASAASEDTTNPCLQKRTAILEQIEYAKQHGNENRVAGLHRALRNVDTYCTPESVQQDRQEKVAQARNKLAERERELLDAKNDGENAEKIAKREAKLKKAQEDLKQAERALGN